MKMRRRWSDGDDAIAAGDTNNGDSGDIASDEVDAGNSGDGAKVLAVVMMMVMIMLMMRRRRRRRRESNSHCYFEDFNVHGVLATPFLQVLHADSPNQPANASRVQFNSVSVRPLVASSGSKGELVKGQDKTSMFVATGEH